MQKKVSFVLVLFMLFSIVLSACAPAAPVAEPTAAPAAPVVEEAPTAEAEVVVAPDFQVLFADLVASIPADKGYGTVKPDVLNTELADNAPFLVDVREPAELEADGYIEGAVNIPVRTLTQNLDKLPGLDEPIVVYCASGHRGGFALAALKLLGYTNVRNLGGGIAAWKKAEFPVATGTPAAAVAGDPVIIEDQALFEAVDGFMSNLPEGFYATKSDKLNAELAESAPMLLDIRTEAEYAKNGYIEGAVNIPFEVLFTSLDKLPAKDQKIVVYCASGLRGAVATMGLRMVGYADVVNLGGGFNAWKAAQFPVAGVVDWNAVWGDYLSTMPADFYSISAPNLNTALAESAPVLVDVREPAEYAEGHLASAINLPVRQLLANLDKLPAQDQPIVIYCASGHRGALGMVALQLLGYTNVKNLGGGIAAWKKAELPVVTDATEPVAGTAPTVDPLRFEALNAFLSGLPDGFSTIKAADLNMLLGEETKPFVLDVRSAEEVANDGAIEGSVNIPLGELWTRLSELPTDKAAPMVVLCKSGHRGAIAMMALSMNGYTDVKNLGGGINAWIAAELPVVK